MGKYFTIIDNSIYIYSIDLSGFDLSTLPKDLGLFTENVPWLISPWLIMSQTITQYSMKPIEEILISQGFVKTLIAQPILEDYFITGNRALLDSLFEEDVDESGYVKREHNFENKIVNDKLLISEQAEHDDS